jgi:serine/threonine protein kinase/tetratricopeptide (TPR) repeat protein
MKHFSPGLSDSIASVIADPPQCPHCDSSSQIVDGLCVGCLLQSGLEPDDECAPESLVSALAEITLPDKNWRLGNYEILEEIGRGGMGVIYRARQRHSRRIVAVKRVLGYHADSRETLARFRREAQAAASLDHPNILPIYEVSESEDGLPFFSMKFAPGGNLQEVGPALRKDLRQCVALVAKIARAVQYAHGKGILHRDLKPGNILLDGSGEPLVSDFGLAKWLDTTSDLTRTLTIFGTPGYIAPEQASGSAAQLKPAADVYSLGAILFDLLAGRPPFLGAHALSVIRQAAESPAPRLRTLSKIADRDLETICARCLERESDQRYRSAHDLAEDLERWLEGRPIIARPVLPPIRVWRWSRRNPKLAASLAAAIILGGAGLVAAIMTSRLSTIVRSAELAQRSVVVTPFEDLDELSVTSSSAKAATSAFATALTRTKGIRASTAEIPSDDLWSDWKKIGEKIRARMVLTGSVRQREGKQRVTLHLIETATGQIVSTWLQDVETSTDFAAASVRRISGFLGATETSVATRDDLLATNGNVNSTGGSTNATARGYYERGKEFLFRYNLVDQIRAIESFRKAVELDPSYGQAHAMLATTCELRSTTDPDTRWPEEAEKAAAAALRIAPMLPETHRANAAGHQRHAHRREAIDGYLTAYELDPSSARAASILGHSYDALGRPDLAIPWYEKATRRETRPIYADNIASAWMSLGDYDKAETAYRTAAVFRPDLPVGDLGLSTVALFRGDYEGAWQQCQAASTKYKDHPHPLIMAAVIKFFSRDFVEAEKLYREALETNRAGGVEFLGSVRFLSVIGFIQKASSKENKEARALLDEARLLDEKEVSLAPESPERLYSLAATCATLDDHEATITDLNKAFAAGWIDYRSMELDPRFDSLRDTRAFKDILNRLTDKVQKMRRQQPGRELASNAN